MREFILFSRGVTSDFNINDLPGAGRMDLVARCVSTGIFLSYSLRPDVKFHVVLNGPPNPPLTITFFTNELKNVSPDERNIASHIKIAIKNSGKKNPSEPGIYVEKISFEELVRKKVEECRNSVFYLHKEGEDIKNFEIGKDFVAILGDNKGLPEKEEIFLERLGVKKISLGKIEYLSSQVVTIINYEVDRKCML
ncbi:MAG: tRNA (pseudouridine(54)-N(1))-methyltransferase TrmY [Candidatus Aenigmarchaeota archaeon]|nr:tRNA (pseudouridine(54)-N(1))-methyltransferase TrmY [Candidatus Aenigmarchaeota archaeon]MCX8190704.1 tRNA (pseudouridine(54)-N(1))-methyltransferase TrmY [Candidatus Aenigmarchaeota archaeon]MDW8159953.1 tRNA (pseudouridine(54)-N(1))-methyltransferase TrmY [Candidatus Aenigmarchaeota archaeon]